MDEKEKWHKEGQKDSSNGEYKRPFSGGLLSTSEDFERNKAYDVGYFCAKANADAETGKYNPPGIPGEKEIYDKAWRTTRDKK